MNRINSQEAVKENMEMKKSTGTRKLDRKHRIESNAWVLPCKSWELHLVSLDGCLVSHTSDCTCFFGVNNGCVGKSWMIPSPTSLCMIEVVRFHPSFPFLWSVEYSEMYGASSLRSLFWVLITTSGISLRNHFLSFLMHLFYLQSRFTKKKDRERASPFSASFPKWSIQNLEPGAESIQSQGRL